MPRVAHARRRLLAALPLLALGACAGLPTPPYVLTQRELQQAVAARLPVRQDLAGLATLEMRLAGLRLLPERGRIALDMDFTARSPLLRAGQDGRFTVSFAPYWQAADLTLRARQVELDGLQLPGMPALPARALEAALPSLARAFADDIELHRLSARDADRLRLLGLRPDAVSVTAEGLRMGFAPAR